jgi:acyl-CoA synthetase (NDP forming)
VLAALFDRDLFDTVAFFFGTMGLDTHVNDRLADAMIAARRAFPERLFLACMMTTEVVRHRLEAEGICVFEDPERLVQAVSRLASFRQAFARRPATAIAARTSAAPPFAGRLSEAAAKVALGAAGVPFPAEHLARTADEAAAAARSIGQPVAMKVVSAAIAHKSDIGGVRLNVAAGDAAAAFAAIVAQVRTAAPGAAIDGVSVAPMITGGVETILGTVNDPDFGPLVVFGLGGVFVEILADTSVRLAPVDETEAAEMIRAIKGFPILAGARGSAPADIGALARAVAALSRFAAAHAADVASVDINPFIARPDGGCAVDALIVARDAAGTQQSRTASTP